MITHAHVAYLKSNRSLCQFIGIYLERADRQPASKVRFLEHLLARCVSYRPQKTS